MGQRLRDGLARQPLTHGFGIRQSGPPRMRMLPFDLAADAALDSVVGLLALQRGVYQHPKHNMFLSVATGGPTSTARAKPLKVPSQRWRVDAHCVARRAGAGPHHRRQRGPK